MTTTYQIAQGQNNAAGLATLDPQPQTDAPVQWDYDITASGIKARKGSGSLDLIYTAFQSYSDLTTFLTTYFNFTFTNGFANEDYVDVTLHARGLNGSDYKNFNGRAYIDDLKRRPGRFENVTIQIRRIVEI